MNNEELDSQLSAMFDDELPAPECELLARRLARDEGLKARWGRYATIGACIRMESGVRLHGDLAGRVSRAIAAEPALLVGTGGGRGKGLASPPVRRWWQPVAGGAVVAASVAAAAILWMRAGSPDAPLVGQTPGPAGLQAVAQRLQPAFAPSAPGASDAGMTPADSDSYVVPPPADSQSFAPPMELANFVVAHSEYSAPLLRRSVLSALIADEPGGGGDAVSPPSNGSRAVAGNGAGANPARSRSRAAMGSRTPHAVPAR